MHWVAASEKNLPVELREMRLGKAAASSRANASFSRMGV
jgi:hypothetical protein